MQVFRLRALEPAFPDIANAISSGIAGSGWGGITSTRYGGASAADFHRLPSQNEWRQPTKLRLGSRVPRINHDLEDTKFIAIDRCT